MRKVLGLVAVLSLLFTSNAFATFINSYLDLNAVDGSYFTVDDGVTESIAQFSYDALTSSHITNTGVVTDAGLAYITNMTPSVPHLPVDNEGLNSLYGMTMVWNDLTGHVTYQDASVVEAVYTSGTINFYIDFNPLQIDSADPGSYTNGTLVATVDVTSGGYTLQLGLEPGSSYLLNGTFSYILPDFWFDADTGEDLADELVGLGWVYAYTYGDNDPESVDITFNADGSIDVDSDHNSSFQIGVVPEPSTFLLLGFGVLGLGVFGYRKRN